MITLYKRRFGWENFPGKNIVSRKLTWIRWKNFDVFAIGSVTDGHAPPNNKIFTGSSSNIWKNAFIPYAASHWLNNLKRKITKNKKNYSKKQATQNYKFDCKEKL